MNIIENSKQMIGQAVKSAFDAAVEKGALNPADAVSVEDILHLEVPKDKQHGDFACNIAMLLAKTLRMPPRAIAEAIAAEIEVGGEIEKVEVAGAGFINFYLSNDRLYEVIRAIEEKGEDYGRIDMGKGKKVMIEFVSANPTGPMHMGNARGGVIGDVLANILKKCGYDVTKEFYINDAGAQIEKFKKSHKYA